MNNKLIKKLLIVDRKKMHEKFSREYPLGLYVHVDVCKTQLRPENLEGKLKHDFASAVSRTSSSHRTYYIHKEDWDTFNKECSHVTIINRS